MCLIKMLHYIVKIFEADDPPIDMGLIETDFFDERGGVFHSHQHGVTVIFPKGAIPEGVFAELKFAALLVAPVEFPKGKVPVSAVYWLCMSVQLQKPVQLQVPHMVNIKNETHAKDLKFVKFQHNLSKESMSVVNGGRFNINGPYGYIEINHFCYYCIVEEKLKPTDFLPNKYMVLAMKQKQSKYTIWQADICLVPNIATCKKVQIDKIN